MSTKIERAREAAEGRLAKDERYNLKEKACVDAVIATCFAMRQELTRVMQELGYSIGDYAKMRLTKEDIAKYKSRAQTMVADALCRDAIHSIMTDTGLFGHSDDDVFMFGEIFDSIKDVGGVDDVA